MINREIDPVPYLPVTFLSGKDNPIIDHGVAARSFKSPLIPGANKVEVKIYFRNIAPSLAKNLNERLQLKKRGDLLDVGISDEGPIVSAFEEKGIKVHGVSIRSHSDSYPPKSYRGSDRFLDGDIVLALDPSSALRDKKFGTILFWGAWDTVGAGDENSMVGNMVYKRIKRADQSTPLDKIKPIVSQEKDKIFDVCHKLLKTHGLLGIVSARYSFLGGGFGISEYDHEMISFMDAIRRGFDVGAQSAYLFGRTRDEFKSELVNEAESIQRSKYGEVDRKFRLPEVQALQQRMVTPVTFPDELSIEDSFLTEQDIKQAIITWNAIQVKESIGFIDAIFLEF